MANRTVAGNPIVFRRYCAGDRAACLALFDANCPQFFAPDERKDFEAYLAAEAADYRVATQESSVVGAFGVATDNRNDARLNWIMIDPACQGAGVGARMMHDAVAIAGELDKRRLHIAASQHSASFFATFGAIEVTRKTDGWGPGMHRIDMVLNLAAAGA
ncbi:MAG: GNAT family N-acetyltransferase [Gammaproteobacteria bacterium]|nr:GNAT family N-acetyltransferase [Gammaproteobacteria bacterium]